MIDISYPQYKMLRTIQRKKLISTAFLSNEELDICLYLLEHDCVKDIAFSGIDFSGNVIKDSSLPPDIKITQTGEAQLYVFRSKFHKWWIPVLISLLSFIVSVLALLRPL